MVIFNLPRGGQTNPKVMRLCARHRVQDMLHQYYFWQYFSSLEGGYPASLEQVVDLGPFKVGTARVQTGF